MGTELITAVSAATTGVKNVYDITTQILRNRKQNKLITEGELEYLEVQIASAIQAAREDAKHALYISAQDKLWESCSRLRECDPNSLFGQLSLELIRDECQSYLSYGNDFDRLTSRGFFR